MLAPATGLARTYRQLGKPPGPMPSFAEQALRHLTPGAIDFCADDLEAYADGDTVGSWVARRGDLTASATGTPAYTAPDQTMRVPSVAYAATGDVHETPATIDWSSYDEATILGVHYTESVSGVARGMSLAGGALSIGDQFGRDNDADPFLAVTVVTHSLQAPAAASLIEVFVNGDEQEGTGSGDSSQGDAWQSDLRVRLGGETATASANGLDGRLHRFVAMPSALTDAQALRASRCLLYTART